MDPTLVGKEKGMSLLHRFQSRTAALSQGTVEEHQAVVELLALAAYSDATVSDRELDQLRSFDAAHASWDEAGFSVLQHLPVAIAAVRSGQVTVEQLAARITTPALRRQALDAVAQLLSADGVTSGESAFLDEVRAALG
jgi:hypothetical protein